MNVTPQLRHPERVFCDLVEGAGELLNEFTSNFISAPISASIEDTKKNILTIF